MFIAGVGLWLRSSTTTSRSLRFHLAGCVRSLSLLVSICYVALIVIPLLEDEFDSDSVAAIVSLLGIGYFLGLIGMLAALIGSNMELRELRHQARRGS